MAVTEQAENPSPAPSACDTQRYAASLRLSVAPMMDWTDG